MSNAAYTANYTKVKAQQLQNTLYLAADVNPKHRFYALYDKIYRMDILLEAWLRAKQNRRSAGVDGIND